MSHSASYLVIGASRGIGNDLAKQLFEQNKSDENETKKVVGTMRKIDENVLPKGIQIEELDITKQSSVDSCSAKFGSIETLIVNAAMGSPDSMLGSDANLLSQYLETNVVGVHRSVLGFLPALRKGKKKQIILLSSTSGSCDLQRNQPSGFQGPYVSVPAILIAQEIFTNPSPPQKSVSKTATNSLGIQYHNELKDEGFTILLIHPGWVATDMGKQINDGKGAKTTQQSASDILKILADLKPEQSGSYLRENGEALNW